MAPRRFARCEFGGAMAEFAVVIPFLLLIAIGVMDYSRVFFTSVAVVNAARAGAEYGIASLGNEANQTNIQNFAKLDGAEASPITVTSRTYCKCGSTEVACTTVCSGGYGLANTFVEVTATKSVALLISYPGLPSSITVARTATFRQK